MTRVDRNQAVRDRLMEQGLAAFAHHGFHGTGVQDIVDAARVPKGSFYNYFDSKEAFGAAVVEVYGTRVHRRLDEAVAEGEHGDALARLRDFLETRARLHEERGHGCLLGNLGCELGAGSHPMQAALSLAIAGVRARFARLLHAAQREGTVRGDLPAEQLADTLFAAWEGSLMRMQVEGSAAPVKRCLDTLLDGVFRP